MSNRGKAVIIFTGLGIVLGLLGGYIWAQFDLVGGLIATLTFWLTLGLLAEAILTPFLRTWAFSEKQEKYEGYRDLTLEDVETDRHMAVLVLQLRLGSLAWAILVAFIPAYFVNQAIVNDPLRYDASKVAVVPEKTVDEKQAPSSPTPPVNIFRQDSLEASGLAKFSKELPGLGFFSCPKDLEEKAGSNITCVGYVGNNKLKFLAKNTGSAVSWTALQKVNVYSKNAVEKEVAYFLKAEVKPKVTVTCEGGIVNLPDEQVKCAVVTKDFYGTVYYKIKINSSGRQFGLLTYEGAEDYFDENKFKDIPDELVYR